MAAIAATRPTTAPPPATTKKKDPTTTNTEGQPLPPASSTATPPANTLATSKTVVTKKTDPSGQPTTNLPPEKSTTEPGSPPKASLPEQPPKPNNPTQPKQPAKPGPTPPITPGQKTYYINAVADEMKVATQFLNQQASTNKSFTALMGGQDFPTITAGTNEDAFLLQINTFLKDLQSDGAAGAALNRNSAATIAALNASNAKIDNLMKAGGLTPADLNGTGSTKIIFDAAMKDYAISTTAMLDTTIGYQNRVKGAADAFDLAWTQTNAAQKSLAKQKLITNILDVITAVGIGGNAATQLMSKEVKNFIGKAGGRTFGALSNIVALRTGQLGDLASMGVALGYSLRNTSGSGDTSSLLTAVDTAGEGSRIAVNKLTYRVKEYVKAEQIKEANWQWCLKNCGGDTGGSNFNKPFECRDPGGPCK